MIHSAEGSSIDLRHEIVDLQIPQDCVVVMNLGAHVPTRVSDRHICAIPELFRSRRLASAGIGRHVMPTEYAIPRLDTCRQNVKHRVLVRDEVASTWQHWAIVASCDGLNQLTLHGSLPKPAAPSPAAPSPAVPSPAAPTPAAPSPAAPSPAAP